MKIGVPKEIVPGERRVALTPDATAALVKSGLQVVVERGAGEGAFHSDAAFEAAGARIVADIYTEADVVLKVQKPTLDEVDRLREGTVLVSFLQALTSADLVQRLAARRITSFGMEGIPRISRAQKMDALSSQANIAGYKAVLIAAESLATFFPMMMTAGGTCELTQPDKVVVVERGVTIHGPTNLPATMPVHASQLYARNVTELLRELVKDGALALDFDDEVVKGACVTHGGEVVSDAVKATLSARKTA